MKSLNQILSDYHDGKATWRATKVALVAYPYVTPDRVKREPRTASEAEAMAENADRMVEGSWDEVQRAANWGWITWDQMGEVNQALWK